MATHRLVRGATSVIFTLACNLPTCWLALTMMHLPPKLAAITQRQFGCGANSSRRGDPVAQNDLGYLYFLGRRCHRNALCESER